MIFVIVTSIISFALHMIIRRARLFLKPPYSTYSWVCLSTYFIVQWMPFLVIHPDAVPIDCQTDFRIGIPAATAQVLYIAEFYALVEVKSKVRRFDVHGWTVLMPFLGLTAVTMYYLGSLYSLDR